MAVRKEREQLQVELQPGSTDGRTGSSAMNKASTEELECLGSIKLDEFDAEGGQFAIN